MSGQQPNETTQPETDPEMPAENATDTSEAPAKETASKPDDASAGQTDEGVAPEASDDPEAPEADAVDPVTRLEAEVAEHKNRYLRTLADMENLRRRLAREREEIRKTAAANIIEDLLPALDNLQIGLDSAANQPEAANVAQGFAFVAQQFRQTLEAHGLQAVAPNAGETFDPNLHEAVGHEPSDVVADGAVLRLQRTGYQLNERLLRAAMVVVSSGNAEEAAADQE